MHLQASTLLGVLFDILPEFLGAHGIRVEGIESLYQFFEAWEFGSVELVRHNDLLCVTAERSIDARSGLLIIAENAGPRKEWDGPAPSHALTQKAIYRTLMPCTSMS
jgi:hypothetical protein